MRGAPGRGLPHAGDLGIIPADAGSTMSIAWWDGGGEDHPRGCGEHRVVLIYSPSVEGSSPRMRGALDGRTASCCPPRIIPADAGSTNIGQALGIDEQDHPRGCGEHHN